MDQKRIRILHVDADRRWLERCAAHLQECHGFEMITACDAETGMAYLEQSAIDCVLSGLRLPGDDGLEFLEQVRRAHPEMPFVLLTADTSERTVETAVEAGVSDYIPKFTVDISEDLLAHRIRQAVASERPTQLTGSGRREVEPSPDRLLHVVESALGGDPGTGSGVGWTDGGSKTLGPTNSGGLFSVVRSAIGPDNSENGQESGEDLVWVPVQGVEAGTGDGSGRSNGSTVDGTPEDFNWIHLGNDARAGSASRPVRTDRSESRERSQPGEGEPVAEPGGHGGKRQTTGRDESDDPDSGGGSGIESLIHSILETGDGTDEPRDSDSRGALDSTSSRLEEGWADVPESVGTESGPGVRASSGNTESNPEVGTPSEDRFAESTDRETGADILPVEDGDTAEGVSLGDDEPVLADESTGDGLLSDDLLEHERLTDHQSGDRQSEDGQSEDRQSGDGHLGDEGERSLSDHPGLDAVDDETLDTLDRNELLHLLRTLLDEDGDGAETGDEPQARRADDSGRDDGPVGSGHSAGVSGADASEETVSERDDTGTGTVPEPETSVTEPGDGETATESESEASVTEPAVDEAGVEPETAESVTESGIEEAGTEPETAESVTEPGDEDVGEDGSEESVESFEPDPGSGTSEDFVQSDDFGLPADVDREPGSSVLVQCGSQDERKSSACTDLLGTDHVADRKVLLVRYRKMSESRLERIATEADRTKIISIGYAQPIPQSVQDTVESVKINNPNDVTRLGIVVSGTIDEWESADGDVVLCYDPLDVLIQYKNVQSAFRFLHIFLSKLESGGVISHFHVDPSAGDPQEINTLKPLFDSVVTIDSVGTHLETQ